MKALSCHFLFGFYLSSLLLCRAQQTANVSTPTPYSIVQRNANSRIWQQTTSELLPSGQTILHLHQYTEMASGLCYQKDGQWVDSQEQINILPNGTAAATNGQHQSYFPGDIYNGVITLVTPDGLRMQSRPIGLSYDDGTNTVLIAELTNSVGQLISSNKVIYANAFDGLSADLLYTYRKGGFEQDVIFREQPPTPEQFGLNSAYTRVQLLTEFFDSPTPSESASAANSQDGLRDTTITFGAMTMIHGRTFLTGVNDQQSPLKQTSVYKSWVESNGRTFLVEETPYKRVSPQLATLPASSAITVNSRNSMMNRPSPVRLLPPSRYVKATTNSLELAKADLVTKAGVVFDYITVNSAQANYTFQGDMTYDISGGIYLSGTMVLEGGTVLKFSSGGVIEVGFNGTNECLTGPYLPAIFTSTNDNSVGETITGSSGSPDYQDVNLFLQFDGTNVTLHDLRFCYSLQGVQQDYGTPNSFNFWNCQFLNVDIPIYAYDVNLYNVLFGYSPNEVSEINTAGNAEVLVDANLTAENVTADSGYQFINIDSPGEVIALTNCLITSVIMTNGFGATLLTSSLAYLPSPTNPVYQIVGNGNYYLANGSPYREVGTPNIDSNLLASLSHKTTYSPMVCSNLSFSAPTNFNQYVSRDTNNYPDIGYHYDSLDYAFGGCAVSTNLTFNAGVAVAWFQCSGPVNVSSQPYTLDLQNGAKVSFAGNVTQPCFFSSVPMVQEGGNRPWNTRNGNLGSIVFNGSGSAPLPALYANFTKWTVQDGWGIFEDNHAHGTASFLNCEFYNTAASTYDMDSMYFTNCLFFRAADTLWDSPALSCINCTFYDGALGIYRNGSPVPWQFQNCAFDGTMIVWQDAYNGTSNTTIDHNAYNTNNLNWQTYPYQYSFPPITNKLEVIGASDIILTNFNWQTSWFGNFYLTNNSLLIQKGNTNANLLGLYHFTTQTNQIPDGTNIVTIGYHYVATDTNGIPLDSNGDGIPDYIQDANGNGLVDNGESPWYYTISGDLNATNGLLVFTPLKP